MDSLSSDLPSTETALPSTALLTETALPPSVNRNERRFHTFQEAENKTGFTLPHNVRMLFRQPRCEQKTKEWLLARNEAITASDFAKAVNLNPYASLNQLITKKVTGRDEFQGNMYTNHGEVYEDCALHLYEKKTGAYVLDFGLLSHWRLFEDMPPQYEGNNEKELEWFVNVHDRNNSAMAKYEKWTWLKGSPDGIALFKNPDGSTKAVLLEIKCPWNMKKGKIAVYYYAQVQLLMYLTDLDECHFVQYQPPDLPFFAEVFDMIVVKRDAEWMEAARNEAWFVWQTILRRRRENNAASKERVQLGTENPENLRRLQQLPDVAYFPEKNTTLPAVNIQKLPFIN